MAMKFWGVEVKASEPFQVTQEDGYKIHLSQAALSDTMKNNETVTLHIKVGEQTLVLGMLSQNTPMLLFDLVVGTDFELSHDWKNGSIHLIGYLTYVGESDSDTESSDEEDDTPTLMENFAMGNAVKALIEKVKAEENDQSDDSQSTADEGEDEDEDIGVDDDVESDEEMGKSDGDGDGDEDDSDGVEAETPAKAEIGKKRSNADAKTPPQSKKAKITTTSNSSKKGDKTPESGGSEVICVPCKRTFKSDAALQSHSKDKHGAK